MDTTTGRDRCSCGRELQLDEATCAACGQRRMDFSARGAQLRLISRWTPASSYPTYDGRTISGGAVKSILRTIDDIIGSENAKLRAQKLPTSQAHAIKRQRIVDESGFGYQTVRRSLRVLDDLSVMALEETRIGESPGHVLMIDWALFSELVEAPAEAKPKAKRPRRIAVSTCPQEEGQLPTGARHLPTGDFHLPTVGSSSLCAPNAVTLPPNPQTTAFAEGGEGGRVLDQLIGKAAKAGVTAAKPLVRSAAEECGVAHVVEIFGEWDRRHVAERWAGNVLAVRLKSAHPSIEPAEGWPVPKGQQALRPQRPDNKAELSELNRRHGTTLDRMDHEAFEEFIAEADLPADTRYRADTFGRGTKDEPEVRIHLLRYLDRRDR